MSTDDVKIKSVGGHAFSPMDGKDPDDYFKGLMVSCSQAMHMTAMSALVQLPSSLQRGDMIWTIAYGLGALADVLVDNAEPMFHEATMQELVHALRSGMRMAAEMTPAEREEWLARCLTATTGVLARSVRVPDNVAKH